MSDETGKPPRADLEQIMYQDLIDKLAVDAAGTPVRAPGWRPLPRTAAPLLKRRPLPPRGSPGVDFGLAPLRDPDREAERAHERAR